MPYWRATVERPDGDGGWVVVGVFGTPDTPGTGTARYLSGDTALDIAQMVLTHVWPVDLVEFNKRDDWGKWKDKREAKAGIADHRITVDVDESNRWSVRHGQPVPDPQTFTVGELLLAEIRAEAVALADARATLKALNEEVRRVRGDVRHFEFRTKEATEEAIRAGVTEPDAAKAGRPPRKPRTNR